MKKNKYFIFIACCLFIFQSRLLASDYIETSRVTDSAGAVSSNDDFINLSAIGQSYHTSTISGDGFINNSGFINTIGGESTYEIVNGGFTWQEAKEDQPRLT